MYVAVKGGEKAIAPPMPYRNTDDGAMKNCPN